MGFLGVESAVEFEIAVDFDSASGGVDDKSVGGQFDGTAERLDFESVGFGSNGRGVEVVGDVQVGDSGLADDGEVVVDGGDICRERGLDGDGVREIVGIDGGS